MGTCERRVRLEAKYGKRKTPEQAMSAERGDAAHDAFFREALRERAVSDATKPWCFIATMAYGPADPRTVLLRAFRDRCLRHTPLGRASIVVYYRVSPGLCRCLAPHPSARIALRAVLKPVVGIAAIYLRLIGMRRG